MAVYNLDDEEINAIYDIDGAELNTAFDLSGSEVFTAIQIQPIEIEQVSEIFRGACTDAVSYINELPDDYVNYVVLTDTHWPSNWRHSAMVCNYLYGTGKVDKMIHLGDMVSDDNVGEAGWNAMVEDGYLHYPNQCLFAQGNHDNHLSPLSDALEYLVPQSAHHTVHQYNNAYYYDNKKYGIRFIVLHHYLYANSGIRDEVANWVKYKPSGYKWAILEHYPFNNGTWEEDVCIGSDAQAWLFGLIDEYSGFIGNFCGHLHLDKYDLLSTGEKHFHQMVFNMDAKGIRADDINGQVITILSINPTAENVKFYRIGRNEVFDSNQWEYTGFTK